MLCGRRPTDATEEGLRAVQGRNSHFGRAADRVREGRGIARLGEIRFHLLEKHKGLDVALARAALGEGLESLSLGLELSLSLSLRLGLRLSLDLGLGSVGILFLAFLSSR